VVPHPPDVVLEEEHLPRDRPRRDRVVKVQTPPRSEGEGGEEEAVERRVEFEAPPDEEPAHVHGPAALVLAEQESGDEVAGEDEEQVHADPPPAAEFG